MKTLQIQCTEDYSKFTIGENNREIDLNKHRSLMNSMSEHGYLPYQPVICFRSQRTLMVYDGQHRLTTAIRLGLMVYYIVVPEKDLIDVAELNSIPRAWSLNDYVKRFHDQENPHYKEAESYRDRTGLSHGIIYSILNESPRYSGTVVKRIKDGTFTITGDGRKYTERFLKLYLPLKEILCGGNTIDLKSDRDCIQAIAMIANIAPSKHKLNVKRFISNVTKRKVQLLKQLGPQPYLEAFQATYNWKQPVDKRVPLAFLAAGK